MNTLVVVFATAHLAARQVPPQTAPAQTPIKAIKILLIGDSTVQAVSG